MKKVYQRKINDPVSGDCLKSCICSLFELDYDDVPNFIEYDDWAGELTKFCKSLGYEIHVDGLFNPNVLFLENPTECCFETECSKLDNSIEKIQCGDEQYGIDGCFLAIVYSPKFTNPNEHPTDHMHAVICDRDFNIIHDPQPEYEHVVRYPYSKLIGFNGIRSIYTFKKI